MRIDTLKQGDRVELTQDFYYGRFPEGTRGTVTEVKNWPGKNHTTISVLIDGDKCATEFTPETSGALRPARSSLDELTESVMDLARKNRIDDAEIYIKDRIEKDIKTMLTRAIFPAAREITHNLAYLEDLAAQEPNRAEESIRNTMITAIQSAF